MKVFLSSSYKDKDFVEKLSADLSKLGIEIWNAESSISPGSLWTDEITKNIKEADAVIFILSKNTLESRFMTTELSFAISEKSKKNKPFIVPIILDKEYLIPPFLERIAYIDFSEPSEYSESLRRLIGGLKNIKLIDYDFSKMYADIDLIKAEEKMLRMQKLERDEIQAKFNSRLAMFSTIFLTLISIFLVLLISSPALSETLWPFFALILGFLTGIFFGEIRAHLKKKQGLKKKKYGRAK